MPTALADRSTVGDGDRGLDRGLFAATGLGFDSRMYARIVRDGWWVTGHEEACEVRR